MLLRIQKSWAAQFFLGFAREPLGSSGDKPDGNCEVSLLVFPPRVGQE